MEEHTFVIPVYKESPYLEACIKSLIGQTVKSKIVIATSTPTTFSKNIAAKYNIPYYVNNSGQTSIATDWNFALANANTKLVTITHQDDIYEPTYAEEVSRVISSNCRKQIQIAFGGKTYFLFDLPLLCLKADSLLLILSGFHNFDFLFHL